MNKIEPGLIALVIFTPMFISLFSVFYLAYFYTEKIESLLSRSEFVKHHKRTFIGLGLMGKVIRSGFIASVLLVPRLMARRGGVDTDQVKNFPRTLKRLLLGSWIALTCSFFALIFFLPAK
ncbi:hypothetical protein SAMN04490202_5927 [Pseudomonas reinekei]|uniref:Uncharacterized protein n=1 Tax=Pseudomonas reinekei TaxID=395598 RepID=A0A1H0V7Q8_PSERE|nr:hypothetical protein BVK86_02425 [Pseudomonas reinekei]SDP74480.1 hypothetical protein SAMN04490202_5927 [Pseudomonas reinekei]